ncbi:multidrug efflux MFS transporter periplasmic adaptor subunit EmrA [Brenneria goodwinii]|uniref:multidrug efflux MFS transporter periplasmic adaptor subunit EmrA n=1 Tax=Brenneria goodwinii TaxID=1109412 RepID=UPI000EF18C06|nr:multidrug efflux MFS transporter periplasmic adaptor subunit EmrA [Brenneria goodwinii]MCG8159145.1 multidrug efflux MFS transporter periplasmic adaptor subunit EmrA [Brenneria goodwinii]MCG8163012.1 multidrug efflux MFS transporter periplasmic adaptor subunit EmrA [Brenneria goodwinii]MCG8168369.1 multidrug efflux MFS transporter periplasmic adaptor subunit EmrA [Brenneria goodwinii]MCG8172988.1 multidrug efflux MFS transporter periplasmic adaptor subunit EmrA [Brenneria goodwinii]MCG81769
MSESVEKQAPQPVKRNKKKQRKRVLTLLTLIFIVLGCAWFVYWFLVLRHHQNTDDSYIAGNQIQVMAQVMGSVTRVNVDNTDYVKQGDVLVELDPTDAQQAFERTQTALANSVRQTHQLMINGKQYQANIELLQIQLNQAQSDLNRRETLGHVNAIGREEVQHARDAVASAKASLEVAKQQYQANQAMILDTPLEQQPTVQQAAAEMRDAWLALQRTKIVSPVNGYVSRRSVQVGARIATTSALMAVVPADHLWVDANFKETQLAKMRIGQPATVIADIYGDDVVYQGKVVGLDMGTGSAFSLLPAQNATGNWIKVVQRLPVRIELDPQQIAEHPLRIGLSALVNVDTADASGPSLSETPRSTPAYASDALSLDLAPVNQMISDIIQANAG